MTTWEPGDVAIRTYLGRPPKRSMYVSRCNIEGHQDGAHWHHQDGGWDMRDGNPTYRPLVVLDPEDREQVERFRGIADRWADQVSYSDMREPGDMDHADAMQAALREFAKPTPPKPLEPTGRYAVVVDSEGIEWLRSRNGLWCYSLPTNDVSQMHRWTARKYVDIDAVCVLSDGVQP